ncbi:MAG: CARDB domain-containing protein [Candidatus Omnitrophota bacterium]
MKRLVRVLFVSILLFLILFYPGSFTVHAESLKSDFEVLSVDIGGRPLSDGITLPSGEYAVTVRMINNGPHKDASRVKIQVTKAGTELVSRVMYSQRSGSWSFRQKKMFDPGTYTIEAGIYSAEGIVDPIWNNNRRKAIVNFVPPKADLEIIGFLIDGRRVTDNPTLISGAHTLSIGMTNNGPDTSPRPARVKVFRNSKEILSRDLYTQRSGKWGFKEKKQFKVGTYALNAEIKAADKSLDPNAENNGLSGDVIFTNPCTDLELVSCTIDGKDLEEALILTKGMYVISGTIMNNGPDNVAVRARFVLYDDKELNKKEEEEKEYTDEDRFFGDKEGEEEKEAGQKQKSTAVITEIEIDSIMSGETRSFSKKMNFSERKIKLKAAAETLEEDVDPKEENNSISGEAYFTPVPIDLEMSELEINDMPVAEGIVISPGEYTLKGKVTNNGPADARSGTVIFYKDSVLFSVAGIDSIKKDESVSFSMDVSFDAGVEMLKAFAEPEKHEYDSNEANNSLEGKISVSQESLF